MLRLALVLFCVSAHLTAAENIVGAHGSAPSSVTVMASVAPESVTAQAQAISPTALVPLTPFMPEADSGFEDFAVTSIISLPFTALWSLLGCMVVTSLWQQKFPPELGDPELIGAATTALGASISIGLISVNWGGTKKR